MSGRASAPGGGLVGCGDRQSPLARLVARALAAWALSGALVLPASRAAPAPGAIRAEAPPVESRWTSPLDDWVPANPRHRLAPLRVV